MGLSPCRLPLCFRFLFADADDAWVDIGVGVGVGDVSDDRSFGNLAMKQPLAHRQHSYLKHSPSPCPFPIRLSLVSLPTASPPPPHNASPISSLSHSPFPSAFRSSSLSAVESTTPKSPLPQTSPPSSRSWSRSTRARPYSAP
jgi:hypothetical protein